MTLITNILTGAGAVLYLTGLILLVVLIAKPMSKSEPESQASSTTSTTTTSTPQSQRALQSTQATTLPNCSSSIFSHFMVTNPNTGELCSVAQNNLDNVTVKNLEITGDLILPNNWRIQVDKDKNMRFFQGNVLKADGSTNWDNQIFVIHSGSSPFSKYSGMLAGNQNTQGLATQAEAIKAGDPIAIRGDRSGGRGLVGASGATEIGEFERLRIERR